MATWSRWAEPAWVGAGQNPKSAAHGERLPVGFAALNPPYGASPWPFDNRLRRIDDASRRGAQLADQLRLQRSRPRVVGLAGAGSGVAAAFIAEAEFAD